MRIGKFIDDNCQVIYGAIVIVMFISILILNHSCNQWRNRFENRDNLVDELITENQNLRDIITKNHINLPKK